jgi:Uma2 family endonuclease
MKPARKPVTYDDLRRVPEHLVAEIVDGELFTSPRPAMRHSHAALQLGGALLNGFDGSDRDDDEGWLFAIEPELHFGADVVVPDLAAWRRTRLRSIPDVAAMTLPPDWVCEVLSPSTARLDRARKMSVYAREGIRHMWILDPINRTLETYRLEDGRWIVIATHAGDDAVRAEPFDAQPLTMRRWWLDATPPAP